MYDLHRLGWHSFQQLCLTIAREVMGQTVQSFLDSNDGGRDGAFAGTWTPSKGADLGGAFVIQCKFTSKADARLSNDDIADELPKIRKLVTDGVCNVYVLMTNAGVSGSRDAQVKAEILATGVEHVLILGHTWIEDQIRDNTRLRMLVPRVYGLGDLSQILDGRAYAQARAVLDSLREDLGKVVVTESYRKAISAIDEHGFVLLIGEPAAGKTTIGAMLAMASADRWKSSVVKLSEPAKIVEHWNVEEPSQFFWIDDAFGITQYESGLVHGWNHRMLEVRAMLKKGVKIVMTSRDYIYARARHDLKQSSFPLLDESQVVIDVHDLSLAERQQILYNHLKLGRQPTEFLTSIKPYLEDVAAHHRFIPETARRLAEPRFTSSLILSDYDLRQFVEKREELLLEVVRGLDRHSKAALGLIYMRKDHLESPVEPRRNEVHALERLGSSLGECLLALKALDGSLATVVHIEDQSVWRFKHPTIGDAYATALASDTELLEIFLAGSSVESLINQITAGNVELENAVIVPKSLFPVLIARLTELTESGKYKVKWMSAWGAKDALYRFLANRCSHEFLTLYLAQHPEVLRQVAEPGLYLGSVPEVKLAVRLHEFGLVPEHVRQKFVETVSNYALQGEDVRALDSPGIRSLFTADEFSRLVDSVRTDLLPRLAEVRQRVQGEHDAGRPPDEHMQLTIEMMRSLKRKFSADPLTAHLIQSEIEQAEQWVAETEPQVPNVMSRTLGTFEPAEEKHGSRSIFDDIDR